MGESYSITLSEGEVKLARWAIRVASNSISSLANEGKFDKTDAVEIIARLDTLDESIYSDIAEDE